MLVLASSSPRRRELLTQWGYLFNLVGGNVSETVPQGLAPEEAVMEIAGRKALKGWENWRRQTGSSSDVVLGADTLVVFNGTMLGKPLNEKDAWNMLSALSGKTHQVMTGIALVDAITMAEEEKGYLTWVEVTTVVFKEISGREIEDYISTGEPMDKAAGYGIQGKAEMFVDHIVGSLTNVIGLPRELLEQKLQDRGILPG
ncbi:Septum formation protein Maf [Syntrophobotulus glycolicus DSM 8271]|uniref:dTTP/UTP pyrophosphatase n=1 Tax=Syntrophobotulus glycolicus (strain DSM 8271 / FlGlyR) TaxID=645991 RepID=F0SVI6_SYNGF|nr:Maf family protein [Syntrophobotulus glycolicus]ADY56759.1 Septum formation protein Maf [Syntrophobotulus glycolicus DSM 8271]